MENDFKLNSENDPVIADLSSLSQQAAESQSEDRGFMEPKPPKRARGRPKKEKTEKPADDTATTQQAASAEPDPMLIAMAQQLTGVISATVAATTGIPQTAMTAQEQASASAILGALGQKYAPHVFSQYGLEMTAITIFGMYFWRVKATVDAEVTLRMKEKERRENQAQAEEEKNNIKNYSDAPINNSFPSIVN